MEAILDDAVPTDQRINEIHIWVMIAKDGGESIISHDLPMPWGTRHTPLMSSKRHIAEMMKPLTERILRRLPDDCGARVELRTFKREM